MENVFRVGEYETARDFEAVIGAVTLELESGLADLIQERGPLPDEMLLEEMALLLTALLPDILAQVVDLEEAVALLSGTIVGLIGLMSAEIVRRARSEATSGSNVAKRRPRWIC